MPSVRHGTDRGCPGAPGRSDALRASRVHEEHTMLDILMLALAAGFFALAIGYTYACERL